MSNTKGQRAYELRQQGHPWATVAEQAGCASTDAAVAGAKKYAARNDLSWPIPVVCERTASKLTRRQQADQVRERQDRELYARALAGTPISDLGNPTAVYRAVDRHAKRNGLPPIPRNGEKAYHMRRGEAAPWADIAQTLGYRYPQHATEAARRHAAENGLEWPLSI